MAPSQGFGVIPHRRAANEVINQVKQQIIAGTLKPGDRLPSEQELATQLGVSRPTVRESLRALTSMNIVETRHGEGSFVASLQAKDLIEPLNFLLRIDDGAIHLLFEARTFMEAGSARLAAERASDEDIAALRELVVAYADHIDDLDRCVQLDLDFHRRIAESGNNPILSGLLESVATLATASRRRTGSDVATRRSAAQDHALILDAIADHDPDKAERAMVTHLEHVSAGLHAVDRP